MRTTAILLLGTLALACAACGKKEPPDEGNSQGPAPPAGAGAELLKSSKDVAQGPGGAWVRHLDTTKDGDVVFKVTSEGPCTVTLITKRGHQVMQRKGKDALPKSEVLFTAET